VSRRLARQAVLLLSAFVDHSLARDRRPFTLQVSLRRCLFVRPSQRDLVRLVE